MTTDSPRDQFADIARSLSNEHGVAATLELATATALTIIEGCDHAGIAVVSRRGKIATVAPTDDLVVKADLLQYDVKDGPCLQSIAEQETVYSADLRLEERWPTWSAKASSELGVRSALSLQLFVGVTAMGSLNLYSDSPDAFGAGDQVSALALAAHVAVAMTSAQLQDGMESAIAHRTVVGQAQGILMHGLGLTPTQAFDALVRVSQAQNVKLHLVAADIVDHGIRPELFS